MLPSCKSNEQLALKGGQPVVTTDFPVWPFYSQDEIDAVQEVINSGRVNYWTGDLGQKF